MRWRRASISLRRRRCARHREGDLGHRRRDLALVLDRELVGAPVEPRLRRAQARPRRSRSRRCGTRSRRPSRAPPGRRRAAGRGPPDDASAAAAPARSQSARTTPTAIPTMPPRTERRGVEPEQRERRSSPASRDAFGEVSRRLIRRKSRLPAQDRHRQREERPQQEEGVVAIISCVGLMTEERVDRQAPRAGRDR